MKRIVTHSWTALLLVFSVSGAWAQVTELDPTDQSGAQFGHAVADAGDVNGDGFGDFIVGAHEFKNTLGVSTGGAFLFLGSENGISTTPDWSSTGDDVDGAQYGSVVAPAGDVNGDGYADVLVGARHWSDGTYTNEGRIYLYLGSETGLSSSADWVADPVDRDCNGSYFLSVAGVGDVNGDGFGDVIMGAPEWGNTYGNEGRMYIFHGSASGLSTSPDGTFDPADQVGAIFGHSAAAAGDVNGDGYADVIVGAYGYGNVLGVDRLMGRAYVFHGSSSGLVQAPVWFSSGDNRENSFFGWAVDSAGDVNGDGYSDVIISASWAAMGLGKIYIYPGSSQGLSDTTLWTSDESGTFYGISVSGAGDFNGDGYSDVVVADMLGGSIQASLFLGGANGPSTTSDQTHSLGFGFGLMGLHVSGAGDLNGDGFDELLVGAQGWESEGRVSVFDGFDTGSGTGSPVTLRQFEADGVTPLVTGAMAGEAQVAFSQNLVNNGSMGGTLGIEVEIKPVGVDFDGTETQVSEGYLASETALLVTSTLTAGPKHWRSRIVYPGSMGTSGWLSYGNNSETDTDFEVPVVETTGGGTEPNPAPADGGSDGGKGGRCGLTGAEAMLMMGLVVLWRRRNRRK